MKNIFVTNKIIFVESQDKNFIKNQVRLFTKDQLETIKRYESKYNINNDYFETGVCAFGTEGRLFPYIKYDINEDPVVISKGGVDVYKNAPKTFKKLGVVSGLPQEQEQGNLLKWVTEGINNYIGKLLEQKIDLSKVLKEQSSKKEEDLMKMFKKIMDDQRCEELKGIMELVKKLNDEVNALLAGEEKEEEKEEKKEEKEEVKEQQKEIRTTVVESLINPLIERGQTKEDVYKILESQKKKILKGIMKESEDVSMDVMTTVSDKYKEKTGVTPKVSSIFGGKNFVAFGEKVEDGMKRVIVDVYDKDGSPTSGGFTQTLRLDQPTPVVDDVLKRVSENLS